MHDFIQGLIYVAGYLLMALMTFLLISYAKGCSLRRAKKKDAVRYWVYWSESEWLAAQFLLPLAWPLAPLVILAWLSGKALAYLYDKVLEPLGRKIEKMGEDKGCGK